MIDSGNMSNREKWIYNFYLNGYKSINGTYPKGQKPIPGIILKKSDLRECENS